MDNIFDIFLYPFSFFARKYKGKLCSLYKTLASRPMRGCMLLKIQQS